jgi:hypothetical protein
VSEKDSFQKVTSETEAQDPIVRARLLIQVFEAVKTSVKSEWDTSAQAVLKAATQWRTDQTSQALARATDEHKARCHVWKERLDKFNDKGSFSDLLAFVQPC